MALVSELRRRNVFRMAALYVVAAWLIMQVAEVVMGLANLPNWVGPAVLAVLAIGFPIALIFSWVYEITPEGLALEKDVKRDESITHITGRRLDFLVISQLAAALAVFAIHTWWPSTPTEPDNEFISLEAEIPIYENSIAVLPFLNIDGSEQSNIFSQGLAEDILNSLAAVPSLRVSARGDSFSLPPNSASEVVRKRLRVTYYLEGSVRILQGQLRVVVQLINSENGFHMLSRQFDRDISNYFEIQDEITNLTVANLRVALPEDTRSHLDSMNDRAHVDAYVLYRRAMAAYLAVPETDENLELALDLFRQSLDIDSGYSAAQAGVCRLFVSQYNRKSEAFLIDKARQACSTALNLNPNLDVVHYSLGSLYLTTGQIVDAKKAFERAIAISPNYVDALTGLADVFWREQRPQEAEQVIQKAADLQPGNWRTFMTYGYHLFRAGRYGEAAEQYRKVLTLSPDNDKAAANLGSASLLTGDFKTSLEAFKRSVQIRPTGLALSNLGIAQYYVGNYTQAVETLRRAVELGPRHASVRANLGDALFQAGQYDAAQEAFSIARQLANDKLKVNSSDAAVLLDAAWVCAMLGDVEAATAHISSAEMLSPNDPYVHYYKALIDIRHGNKEAALDSLERALQLGYPSPMIAAEPYLKEIRTNPRFVSLTRKKVKN